MLGGGGVEGLVGLGALAAVVVVVAVAFAGCFLEVGLLAREGVVEDVREAGDGEAFGFEGVGGLEEEVDGCFAGLVLEGDGDVGEGEDAALDHDADDFFCEDDFGGLVFALGVGFD